MYYTTPDNVFAIFPRTRNTFDVFKGDEFAQHSYFRSDGKRLRLIKGASLSSAEYKTVKEFINDKLV